MNRMWVAWDVYVKAGSEKADAQRFNNTQESQIIGI